MNFPRIRSSLRHRLEALINRRAAMIRRQRMRRAEAQLPQGAREKAAFWRTLHLARNARLQREREARDARRSDRAKDTSAPRTPASISKADVLDAIARSRATREARLKAAREERNGR